MKNKVPANSLENLKKGCRFTEENARAKGRKGGLVAAKVKKTTKTMKELSKIILHNPEKKEVVKRVVEMYPHLTEEDVTNGFVMLAKQVEKARAGDLTALNFLVEMSGEKPKADTDITINNNLEPRTINVTFVRPEDVKSQDELDTD